MIPSEYETIIQMLLNEVIRLRRESDNTFRNALAEASFRSHRNPTTGTGPIGPITLLETPRSAVKDKENKVPFIHRAAANQHGHMVAGKWIPNNRVKVPKRGKGGLFTK